MVREKPLPFPPEPLRWAGVQLTRWSLARADAHGGRRNLWLRALDRASAAAPEGELGFGFSRTIASRVRSVGSPASRSSATSAPKRVAATPRPVYPSA